MAAWRHACVALLALLSAPAATWAQLVPNPDFESGTGGALGNWLLHPKTPIPDRGAVSSPQGVAVSWAEGSARTGERCLKMEGHGRAGGDFALVGSPRLRLLPGFSYEVALFYHAEGLVPESGDRTRYAAAIMDLFFNGPKGFITSCRIITFNNSKGWVRLSKTFSVPLGTTWSQVRLQLVNKCPNAIATVWWDDVSVVPLDGALPNPGFEVGANLPDGWEPVGAATGVWAGSTAHTGGRSVAVSNAGAGAFSGWATVIPVRQDRAYSFGGYARGGDLKPDGPVGGAALCLQFLDSEGQPVGEPVISPVVPALTDWTLIATPKAQPPVFATMAQLIAGLQFCRGTAWFDDLTLSLSDVALRTATRIQRRSPQPQEGIRYSKNLLANGTIEEGDGQAPAGWTYHGRAKPDWTKDQLRRMYDAGYPRFEMGRGRGEWSRGFAYAGNGALLNISIDPPLSPQHKWYGRGVVDGYWLSDPMPCTAGQAYLSGGWLRPGAPVEEAWLGPLEVQFFNAAGRKLTPANNPVRPGIAGLDPGAWSYYATVPYVAPEGAATMRLRFGQEFRANRGGWGRTYADNLAVWELPPNASIPSEVGLMTERYRAWFCQAHSEVKPPYLPSPTDAPEYESCWGKSMNLAPGNLFHNRRAPVPVRFALTNLLGEWRLLRLRITRTDWLGRADRPIETRDFAIGGYGSATVDTELPPSRAYGAFHLDVEVIEGKAVVGRFAGRYAVLPHLERPRTAENLWGVTPLVPIHGDSRAFERELGELLKIGGFGIAWVRMYFSLDPHKLATAIADKKREVEWYRRLGLRCVLQLMPRTVTAKTGLRRTVDRAVYEAAGKRIGAAFKGSVAAVGNWGIELANSASPFRGGRKNRLTDEQYDTILAGLYDGLKAVDRSLPVLIGNIATDWEAKTVRRLYGQPAEGRFDGAILNAYMGLTMTVLNNLHEFDVHGDTQKTVWQEENADQRSPFKGDSRRYSEADGARNMVRSWLSLYAKAYPRIKAITMWGFVTRTEQDIMMVTPTLQPRPQFVAHAVMADALADAVFVADHSSGDTTFLEWQRGDGPFLALWANAGERALTLEVPKGKSTVMDLMGNREDRPAPHGLLTLKLTTTPVYLFGGGHVAVSRRLELALGHGGAVAGKPMLRLTITNNDKSTVAGQVTFRGPVVSGAEQRFALKPGQTAVLTASARPGLPPGERTPFRVECRTEHGALYATSRALNFAQAVRAATPPQIDGSWSGWDHAIPIAFGQRKGRIVRPTGPWETYDGAADVAGNFRLLWDDHFLYLGVEALDDAFVPNPERGMSGFMGDSVEFAVQPDNMLSPTAEYWEFELYLPAGKTPYAASRRAPLPRTMVTDWRAAVAPTGERGNVRYQAAIPWADLGVADPRPGRTFSFALVLNDKDNAESPFTGGRPRIRWFKGIDTAKNPEGFGDVTLVQR